MVVANRGEGAHIYTVGSPATMKKKLKFCLRHDIKPMIETYKFHQINDAIARLRSGVARFSRSGALKANVDSRFTVAEIKQAVTRAGQRGRNGKALIVPKSN